MTCGRRDTRRRHRIPRGSKATVVPLDVQRIPRGTINLRPRETIIDLTQSRACFPTTSLVSRIQVIRSTPIFTITPRCAIRRTLTRSRPIVHFAFWRRLFDEESSDFILGILRSFASSNNVLGSFTIDSTALCNTKVKHLLLIWRN